MPRPEPTATDRQRLQRLDRTIAEIKQREKELDDARSRRNVLIYQLQDARVISAGKLARRAEVSEPYVYRCLHGRGVPKTGAPQ